MPLFFGNLVVIFLLLIHLSSYLFMKIILLKWFIFWGKSPFLIKRLIVETDILSNAETSLIVKKRQFSWFFMLGICWGDVWISWIFISDAVTNYHQRSTRFSLGEFYMSEKVYQRQYRNFLLFHYHSFY